MTTTFAGKELLLQKHVHDQVDKLIPLTKFSAGFRFAKLRPGLEDIIYKNRFLKTEPEKSDPMRPMVPEIGGNEIAELDGVSSPVELPGEKRQPLELPAELAYLSRPPVYEKEGSSLISPMSGKEGMSPISPTTGSTSGTNTTADDLLSNEDRTSIFQTLSESSSSTRQITVSSISETGVMERTKSDNAFSRSTRKWSTKLGLRKSKTVQEQG